MNIKKFLYEIKDRIFLRKKNKIILNQDNDILEKIIDFYLNSNDFNGIELSELNITNKKELENLIDEELIEVLSEKEVLNPRIRAFKLNTSKNIQKKNIYNTEICVCLYPTEKSLKGIHIDYKAPYTSLLKSGKSQLDIIFFDIEILERYINNPKFLIMDNGYRGTICIRDEYYEENEDEYIKDYGMAYIEGEKLNRAIGVFLSDLSKLSPKSQMLWSSFELENQSNCKINSGFVKNLIYGDWVDEYWIFQAIIDEMNIINQQCEKMEIPYLFSHTYGVGYYEMPEGYRNILLPTKKNYYDFILVLEKMIVNNISIKTFQKDVNVIKGIERKDEKGKDKGSLVMFSEWLNKNIRTPNNMDDDIIKPLKKIRKIRQIPAHELTNNEYDLNLYEEQRKIVKETYIAIRNIRLLFSNHPLAKTVNIPEYLKTGEKIVEY